MGLENSNLPQSSPPSDPPVEPGQRTSQETSFQASNGQSGNDSLASNAPLDSFLPSMMKSLTPSAPATSGDSAPQYPSLEAAVSIEQEVAPTLTNLLAAKTQEILNLGLASPAVAMADAARTDSQPSPVLQDEQDPLAGEAIAVQRPDSTLAAAPTPAPIPATDPALPKNKSTEPTEQDSSWAALDPESAPDEAASELNSIANPASDVVSNPIEDETSTAQDNAATVALSPPAAPAAPAATAAKLVPAQAETTAHEAPEARATEASATEGKGSDESPAEQAQPDDEDFDQVKAGADKGDRTQQVLIKREDTHVAVIFPEEETNANPDVALDFIDSQLWQDLQQRLSGGTVFASDTPVHLYSQNCLLDTRQLQELDEALGRFNLKLERIITRRRQTAVAAAMSGYSADQTNRLPELLSKEIHSPQRIGLAEPLYLQKNIRSGTEIRHPGSVIIMGDLNPGSSIIADGDILIWGRLRGIAHAGAAGNQASIVMALKLEAPQLRIAGAVARVDVQGKGNPTPEIAYIDDKAIRITAAYGFNRSDLGELGS